MPSTCFEPECVSALLHLSVTIEYIHWSLKWNRIECLHSYSHSLTRRRQEFLFTGSVREAIASVHKHKSRNINIYNSESQPSFWYSNIPASASSVTEHFVYFKLLLYMAMFLNVNFYTTLISVSLKNENKKKIMTAYDT